MNTTRTLIRRDGDWTIYLDTTSPMVRMGEALHLDWIAEGRKLVERIAREQHVSLTAACDIANLGSTWAALEYEGSE